MKIALSILIAIVVLVSKCNATRYDVTAVGQLLCNEQVMDNVNVLLREHDTLDPDDTKNATISDSVGTFSVYGWEDEYGKVEFYMRFLHNCDVKDVMLCTRETDYKIPRAKWTRYMIWVQSI